MTLQELTSKMKEGASKKSSFGNTVKFTGLPLSEVIAMATTTPAKYLGIQTSGTIHARWDATTFRFTVNRVT